MTTEHFDVLIVGSGISGIGAACHLRTDCPGKSFAILEGRERIGGTWDLFKYPGIRSDSDMHTLGFAFKPWTHEKSIADAPAILEYLRETTREYHIEKEIRFQHKVTSASFDSSTATWTVGIETGDKHVEMTCGFLFMCTGYYSYTDPYRPEFPGRKQFTGPVIHPQFWPDNLDYQGKKVVVIGSGATAVTIVPALATSGVGQVTMLQRSPTYFLSRPAKDVFANTVRKILPEKLAYAVTRWKNINMQAFFYKTAQTKPEKTAGKLIDLVSVELGADYDVKTHFTPRYKPWDQRMCLVPDADMFAAMRSGKADVVTDEIEAFTATGITLKSGKSLDADIIVTATGLKMEIMSGVSLTIDGVSRKIGDTFSYKGCMYSDIPNLASSFGYSNASWTLKADLISEYVCRILKHIDETGKPIVVARPEGIGESDDSLMNLSSGYVQRSKGFVPKQGNADPWIVHHDYGLDKKLMRYGKLEDGALRFEKLHRQLSPQFDTMPIAAE